MLHPVASLGRTHEEVAMGTSGQRTAGSASTLTLIVTMVLRPEHEAEFLAFAQTTMEKVIEHEPGTLLYTLHRHPTEPHAYVWVERYADAAAFTAHSETPYIGEAMSKLRDWLARPPEVQRYQQIAPT